METQAHFADARRQQALLELRNLKATVRAGVDPARPGIYVWEIEGVGRYVGKYTSPRRPLGAYRANVRRLLLDLPYRRSDPDGFRYIHRALVAALNDGRKLTLTIWENVEPTRLNEREQQLIRELGCTLNR